MDVQAIATQVAEAIKEAPEKAQDLIGDPKKTIEGITGEKGFDVTEVLQAVVGKVSEMGLDLSHVDLSKLDLSALDVSKLDLGALKDAAGKLSIDVSKLDVGSMASGVIGNIGGALGGLFGKK